MKDKGKASLGKITLAIFSVMVFFFLVQGGCNSSGQKDKNLKPAQVGEKVAEAPIDAKDTTAYKETEKKKAMVPVMPKEPLAGKVYSILIDKSSYTLTLLQDGQPIKTYKIAVGKNAGQKQAEGDLRTPDGDFSVDEVCEAGYWTHDFGDGKGEIKGAYGPWFISLDTPGWTGIGIHGTHAPESLGTRASEGCVRLNNADLVQLVKFVKMGTKVKIQE